MDVIDTTALASYLRDDDLDQAALGVLVDLTNGVITETAGVLDPVPVTVRAVAIEVAARAYRNPDGAVTESGDDYGYRRADGTAAAGVYLTASESAQLQRFRRAPRRPVGSIRLRVR